MNPYALTITLAIGGPILTAILVFIATQYWSHRTASLMLATKIADENELLIRRVDALDKQLSLLSQAVVPISVAYQNILVRELTHYHTPVLDALLAKLGPPYTLTEEEEAQFFRLLQEREKEYGDLITQSERDAARILPVVMRRVKAELVVEESSVPTLLQLVRVLPINTEAGGETPPAV